jgi:hypothetical protein
MAPVLKTGIPERVSGVRIPPSPPELYAQKHRELTQKQIGEKFGISPCTVSHLILDRGHVAPVSDLIDQTQRSILLFRKETIPKLFGCLARAKAQLIRIVP